MHRLFLRREGDHSLDVSQPGYSEKKDHCHAIPTVTPGDPVALSGAGYASLLQEPSQLCISLIAEHVSSEDTNGVERE